VLEHIDDVGPGYGAIWVTGMSQVAWPPRPQHNPLLPRRLMHELRVPWGSREDCLERAASVVERVAGLAADVVFSCAPGDDEDHAQPSAMLQRWLGERHTRASRTGAAQPESDATILPAAANLEVVPESLQRLAATQLTGGAALLNAQATCPLRAFIDYRLGGRPLQPWLRGLPPALRGRILHRAAAWLLEPGTDSAQLAGDSGIDWHTRIDAAAERALDREIGDARLWFAALTAMEQSRVRQALLRLLEADRARSGFTVDAVETPVRLSVDEFVISARVDRLDRLDGGGFAVIDYKTGRSAAQPYWFDDQHADYQLPLYVVALGETVTALALCSLGPDAAIYRGYWPEPKMFPGIVKRRDDSLEWSAQIGQWHDEIEALIRAFVAGDVAFDAHGRDQLTGPYAPLSRIAEADFVDVDSESS